MSYELFVLFQFLSHVTPMSYELSCEILVLSHVSPTSYGLSREILVLIACVAHALSVKFIHVDTEDRPKNGNQSFVLKINRKELIERLLLTATNPCCCASRLKLAGWLLSKAHQCLCLLL